jgi:two-component system, chemotaxis family, CheB/CheR fusion protein
MIRLLILVAEDKSREEIISAVKAAFGEFADVSEAAGVDEAYKILRDGRASSPKKEAVHFPTGSRFDCILAAAELAGDLLRERADRHGVGAVPLVAVGPPAEEAALIRIGARGFIPRDALGGQTILRAVERAMAWRGSAVHVGGGAVPLGHLDALVQFSGDAIVGLDADAIIRAWNPGAERLFEFTAQEAIGKSIAIIAPPELREEQKGLIHRLCAGENVSKETTRMTKIGARVSVILNAGPIFGEHGEVTGISSTLTDITGRRRAEEALRQSEAFNRCLMSSSTDCVKVLDLEGRLQLINEPGICIMEIGDIATFRGKSWVDMWPENSRDTIRDSLNEARAGRGYRFQGFCPTAKNTPKWWDVQVTPVRDEDGMVRSILAISRDVTQLRWTSEQLLGREQELVNAKESAEAANRAKDRFLAVLSHELRTPLTPVLTTLQILLRRPETDRHELKESLELIRRNVELEARLIDDMLDLTRISSSKLELHRSNVDAHETILQAVQTVASELQAKGVLLKLDLSAHRRWIHSDPARMQQVIWNLLKNATKFTPSGGCVMVRCRESGDARLKIEVEDTGVGVEANVLPRIFDAFEQGGMGITRQFGGLGLGLSICKALVHMHGGTIEAYSEGTGKGATFTVELPLATAAQLAEPMLAGGPLGVETKMKRKPARILVVEDHPDTARSMNRLLTSFGFRVVNADTIAVALQRLASEPFDAVVSDIGLPDGSGLDLMRQISVRHPDMPGIALSGFGMEEDRWRSREAGFREHLVKPVDINALRAVIERLVEKGKQEDATAMESRE